MTAEAEKVAAAIEAYEKSLPGESRLVGLSRVGLVWTALVRDQTYDRAGRGEALTLVGALDRASDSAWEGQERY